MGTITRPLYFAHNRPDDGPNGGPKPEVNCDESPSVWKSCDALHMMIVMVWQTNDRAEFRPHKDTKRVTDP